MRCFGNEKCFRCFQIRLKFEYISRFKIEYFSHTLTLQLHAAEQRNLETFVKIHRPARRPPHLPSLSVHGAGKKNYYYIGKASINILWRRGRGAFVFFNNSGSQRPANGNVINNTAREFKIQGRVLVISPSRMRYNAQNEKGVRWRCLRSPRGA